MKKLEKIVLGGGCHWCTEAVFQSLKGVDKVVQGYASSTGEHSTFSEAIMVYFEAHKISLKTLIEVHLHTHRSTKNHSMRAKYRSAVYVFSKTQDNKSKAIIERLQQTFEDTIITKVIPFGTFKASRDALQNYYQKDPEKPFCRTYINPKLSLLLNEFSKHVNSKKLKHLIS